VTAGERAALQRIAERVLTRLLFPVIEAVAAGFGARVPDPWDRNAPEVWVRWWLKLPGYAGRRWWRRVRGGPDPPLPLGPRRRSVVIDGRLYVLVCGPGCAWSR
jgi:hypothetical protein